MPDITTTTNGYRLHKARWCYYRGKDWEISGFWENFLPCQQLRAQVECPRRFRGGKRGRPHGFSFASALRLRETLLGLDYSSAAGIAITFPSGTDNERIRLSMAQLTRHWARVPATAAVWRLEKTRVGTYHYHLIVWAQNLVEAKWSIVRLMSVSPDCLTVNNHASNYTPIDTHTSAVAYLCGHTGKHKAYQVVDDIGVRHWGVIGRSRLPRDDTTRNLHITVKQYFQLRRAIRRYNNHFPQRYLSCTLRFTHPAEHRAFQRIFDNVTR